MLNEFVLPNLAPAYPELFLLTMACAILLVDVIMGAAYRSLVGALSLLALFGIAAGTVTALFVTRLLSAFLFGIAPNDPVAFGVVILVLAAVALIASFVPALRATRVDPVTALRNG